MPWLRTSSKSQSDLWQILLACWWCRTNGIYCLKGNMDVGKKVYSRQHLASSFSWQETDPDWRDSTAALLAMLISCRQPTIILWYKQRKRCLIIHLNICVFRVKSPVCCFECLSLKTVQIDLFVFLFFFFFLIGHHDDNSTDLFQIQSHLLSTGKKQS